MKIFIIKAKTSYSLDSDIESNESFVIAAESIDEGMKKLKEIQRSIRYCTGITPLSGEEISQSKFDPDRTWSKIMALIPEEFVKHHYCYFRPMSLTTLVIFCGNDPVFDALEEALKLKTYVLADMKDEMRGDKQMFVLDSKGQLSSDLTTLFEARDKNKSEVLRHFIALSKQRLVNLTDREKEAYSRHFHNKVALQAFQNQVNNASTVEQVLKLDNFVNSAFLSKENTSKSWYSFFHSWWSWTDMYSKKQNFSVAEEKAVSANNIALPDFRGPTKPVSIRLNKGRTYYS